MVNRDFEIGIITKPQGIRGEVRVLPSTDDSSRFSLLVDGEISVGGEMYNLTSARLQKNMVIIKLEGINDRNAAEALAGKAITIPPEKALTLADDEYYVRDLIGLCAETEEGEVLGVVSRVINTSANDIYVIEQADGKSFMVPAVKDFVRAVSVSGGKIVFRLLEGMRELSV